ncbi:N-acetylglucosamine-6-phosphate deacetylase [Clostridium botulinum]|uniref:N-acetylglucosamine-6-phosphate deacetylase n=1 Tax=Clostridium botulinum TaxID=1491 RepID=A0A6B4JH99_CLOBO|nr:N-acetylglucosamine-6-phosphate deacetylase [Clostridium botulinum]EES48530.1 N-acetylglucosamine-6-phosphate deacetylase [Clostridium botulinum E1 str. 'BoNT E Beluga']MBY6759595.1 N-acetylglucosamine-6-phosphate deacetylase [Clostridium botulinum]MBY6918503.1 N-acetylglucosamine-6-phosphate deacetylase [Clostridium botulinum]MCR1129587.1 N-acetylglucosamine-6-phosphate deacetylase [Clostridium botulinum]NFJ56320.1 N-acetylglucosamine-6-phosphate deacetylase [Clostridium botulinum]
MLITNCNIIYLDKIEKGSIIIQNGKIKKINPSNFTNNEINQIIDAKGLYLSPGFIDAHIHGAGGCDTMDGTIDSINTIAKTIAKHGTTSFVPTTMTVSISNINKSMRVIKLLKEKGSEGAHVLGAHLEGPFINPNAIGAQNPDCILPPSISTYKSMVKDCEDSVISLTLAPELDGSKDLIKYLSDKGIICSLGHTKATYEETIDAIKCGATHSTHLYNAMPSFTHRNPGIVGAIFDSDIKTEIISDGIHISYPALRIAYKQKGTDNVLLITDAMMACCMPDGKYELGGQDVIVKNGAARVKSGSLAGSILTLDKAIKNIYKNSALPLNEIVKMASYNPAKHCKVDNHKGLIKEGYDADLILFDDNINIKRVFISGKEFY